MGVYIYIYIYIYIIQQIVTMPIYGREALNCLLSVNDRYPVIYLDDIFGSALQIFSHCLFGGHFEKRLAVLAVFSGTFNSLEETFHD